MKARSKLIFRSLKDTNSYSNDSSAAAAGVQLGELYRNEDIVKIRMGTSSTTTISGDVSTTGNLTASGTITSTSTVSRPIQNNEDDDATNTDSKPIRNIRNMKQTAYDDLVTAGNVDDHTLYIIVG